MPESYPDFPHHTQIAAYFDDYVDHFGFREKITFETGVEHAGARRGRGLDVAAGHGRDAPLRRAAGRQRPPLGPALARTCVPGLGRVRRRADARALLRRQLDLRGQVAWSSLGMGNSAMDIAVESSYVAERTYLAARQRRLDRAQVHLRQTGRPAPQRRARPVQGAPADHAAADSELRGTARALRAAQARAQVRRGAPHRVRADPRPDPARHDHAQAEHRLAGGLRGPLRRRHRRGGRRRRLLHRLQDHLPVLRRGPDLGAGQPHRAVPAGSPPGHPQRVLHRPAAAAAGRSCRCRRRRARGWGTTCSATTRRPRTPSCSPTSPPTRRRCARATWPPSGTRSRSTSTTTYTRSRSSAARAPSARVATGTAHRRYADLLRHGRFLERCPICSKTLPGHSPGASRRQRRGVRAAQPRQRGAGEPPPAERAAAARTTRGPRRGRRVPQRAGARPARVRRRRPPGRGDRLLRRSLLALALDPPGLYGELRRSRRATSSVPAGAASWRPTCARYLAGRGPVRGDPPGAGLGPGTAPPHGPRRTATPAARAAGHPARPAHLPRPGPRERDADRLPAVGGPRRHRRRGPRRRGRRAGLHPGGGARGRSRLEPRTPLRAPVRAARAPRLRTRGTLRPARHARTTRSYELRPTAHLAGARGRDDDATRPPSGSSGSAIRCCWSVARPASPRPARCRWRRSTWRSQLAARQRATLGCPEEASDEQALERALGLLGL